MVGRMGAYLRAARGSQLARGGDGQLISVAFEVPERERCIEGELKSGAGDEVLWGEDEEGDAGLFSEVAQAVPRGGGDVVEFCEWIELEVEDEEGKVAIVQKEVATAERFLGIVAADPEEAGARGGIVGRWIEGIASVDESDLVRLALVFILGFEELGEDEGQAGGGTYGSELGESAGGKGGQRGGEGEGRFRSLLLMGSRELLPELLAEGLEVRVQDGEAGVWETQQAMQSLSCS